MNLETEKIIKNLLVNYGENPDREGLLETPKRVKKMYDELLSGYKHDPKEVFKLFDSENYTGQISINNIEFSSLCEHHLLPFYGTVDITYTPNGKVLGLSKFSRIVDILSKRLQLQEKLTREIAETIKENLHPANCSVTIRAKHMCMTIRGVKSRKSITITSYTI
jgi:GTP cyclohydrolase I